MYLLSSIAAADVLVGLSAAERFLLATILKPSSFEDDLLVERVPENVVNQIGKLKSLLEPLLCSGLSGAFSTAFL
jgi:hypothetical protein